MRRMVVAVPVITIDRRGGKTKKISLFSSSFFFFHGHLSVSSSSSFCTSTSLPPAFSFFGRLTKTRSMSWSFFCSNPIYLFRVQSPSRVIAPSSSLLRAAGAAATAIAFIFSSFLSSSYKAKCQEWEWKITFLVCGIAFASIFSDLLLLRGERKEKLETACWDDRR